jgi:hypothetical protein
VASPAGRSGSALTDLKPDRAVVPAIPSIRVTGRIGRSMKPADAARIVLTDRSGVRSEVAGKPDDTGRFEFEVPPGEWLIHAESADGKRVFLESREITAGENVVLSLGD